MKDLEEVLLLCSILFPEGDQLCAPDARTKFGLTDPTEAALAAEQDDFVQSRINAQLTDPKSRS